MNYNEIIPYIISAIGGGGLGGFLGFRISLKKQNLSEFEVLIKEHKELRKNLEERIEQLEEEYKILQEQHLKDREEVWVLRHKLKELEDERKR